VVTVPPVDRERYLKFETPAVRAVDLYVAANFVAGGTATAFLLYFAEEIPRGVVMLLAACILAATYGWGRVMEGKRGAQRFEIARWIVTIAVMSLLAWRGSIELRVAVLVGAIAFAFGVWSTMLRRSRVGRANDEARSALHAR
jgi:hypothetical protein